MIISLEDYEYMREDYIGKCLACGEERECTEPDAENYPCEACGKNQVVGADHFLFSGMVG